MIAYFFKKMKARGGCLRNYIIDIVDKLLTSKEIQDFRFIANNRKKICSLQCLKSTQRLAVQEFTTSMLETTEVMRERIGIFFRPIQYINAYLKMKPENFNWVTREIIHMSGLHLGSMIKRLFNIRRYPLGQALALPLAKVKSEKNICMKP
ncbi:hypothetical protein ACFSQ7_21365 [Paenibacillus rhizoplanae]